MSSITISLVFSHGHHPVPFQEMAVKKNSFLIKSAFWENDFLKPNFRQNSKLELCPWQNTALKKVLSTYLSFASPAPLSPNLALTCCWHRSCDDFSLPACQPSFPFPLHAWGTHEPHWRLTWLSWHWYLNLRSQQWWPGASVHSISPDPMRVYSVLFSVLALLFRFALRRQTALLLSLQQESVPVGRGRIGQWSAACLYSHLRDLQILFEDLPYASLSGWPTQQKPRAHSSQTATRTLLCSSSW